MHSLNQSWYIQIQWQDLLREVLLSEAVRGSVQPLGAQLGDARYGFTVTVQAVSVVD